MTPHRFSLAGAAALLLAALALAGCASSPPQRHYYRLPLTAPGAPALGQVAPQTMEAPPARAGVWLLQTPVRMPEYLERDALWLPVGGAGLQPLEDQRWAEPLRDAVPRVLRQDLATLLGPDRVWSGSVPPGVQVAAQLRVELLALEPTLARDGVRLSARWTLADPQGKLPTRIGSADLVAPSTGQSPEQLVTAHRLALWQLAEKLARSLPPPGLSGAVTTAPAWPRGLGEPSAFAKR